MKPEIFNQEFNKLFKWFTNESDPSLLKLELDIHKKLLNFFVVGNSFYYVINHNSVSFDLISKEVEEVLGYAPSELGFDFLINKIHPDDRPWFLALGQKMIEFFSALPIEKMKKYKLRYDVRYRKNNGEYARILYQGIIIEQDKTGRLLRSLALNTDITYLKREGKPVLSFIGLDGEPSYVDVDLNSNFTGSKDGLSRREKDILKLLIEGKPSKEIGSILNISKHTVDTHRKNMLHKNNLSSTGELVGKAIRCGWI